MSRRNASQPFERSEVMREPNGCPSTFRHPSTTPFYFFVSPMMKADPGVYERTGAARESMDPTRDHLRPTHHTRHRRRNHNLAMNSDEDIEETGVPLAASAPCRSSPSPKVAELACPFRKVEGLACSLGKVDEDSYLRRSLLRRTCQLCCVGPASREEGVDPSACPCPCPCPSYGEAYAAVLLWTCCRVRNRTCPWAGTSSSDVVDLVIM